MATQSHKPLLGMAYCVGIGPPLVAACVTTSLPGVQECHWLRAHQSRRSFVLEV